MSDAADTIDVTTTTFDGTTGALLSVETVTVPAPPPEPAEVLAVVTARIEAAVEEKVITGEQRDAILGD